MDDNSVEKEKWSSERTSAAEDGPSRSISRAVMTDKAARRKRVERA
jgi:hypothetical protein